MGAVRAAEEKGLHPLPTLQSPEPAQETSAPGAQPSSLRGSLKPACWMNHCSRLQAWV